MPTQLDSPVNYSIRILGYLDESYANRLGGMQITHSHGHEEETITTLTGPLIDQAALSGVLNALYDMRFSLLLVEYLGSG
jgi:hypothetical protein